MTEELKEQGLNVGHRRVGRLMRENAISVIRTRKHKVTTNSKHTFTIAPNLLARNFSADRPDQKWVVAREADVHVTSVTFGRVKAGSIWPWFWTCIPGVSSAGLSAAG